MTRTAKTIIGVLIAVIVIWGGVTLSQRDGRENGDVGGEQTRQDQPVKIGWMGPLSGDASSYGESIKRGVELAKKELAGNVEIVFEDSKCDGKEAVTVINKLINVDKVQAIIGEVCSGATLAAAPVAEGAKVVLLSPSSTSPKISDAGKYIFRVIPSDALQGDFGAKLVYENGQRNLAILYSNEEYGLGFNNVLRDSFTALGGQVVGSEAFERGASDVRTQVTKVKNANPDAVYVISNSPDAAAVVLKQLKEAGVTAKVYGSEGLKSDAVISGAGAAAEGMVLTTVSAGTADFLSRHQEEYKAEPGPFAAQGYDAYQAIATAVKNGAKTGEEIRARLDVMEFDGVSGKIAFDERGDVAGNYDIFEVKDGKFVQSK